ncbi:MAG: hypothetical protein GY948_07250 [Alphaproteobacteria bacterium]|nr:hypothetical protein [Alphaproteobacteria bacterium]
MDLSLNLITPVILCGGFGSLQMGEESAERPKPFRKLSGNLSRFQQTLLRVSDPGRFNPPMIVADQAHQSLIEFEMEMIGVERSALVLEPVGRGTAPSIALAALVAGAFNLGGSLLVMPCDHLVRDPGGLITAIHQGLMGTRNGSMLAFGRKVKAGDEEHAWIQRGRHLFDETCADVVDAEVYRLERFIPKSAAKDENALADGGDCYRNSGMYLFPIASVLEELRVHVPDILTGCQHALVSGTSEGNILMPDEDQFAACQNTSIERAVMEKTARGALVPTSALWSEEGARPVAPEVRQSDEAEAASPDNVILREAANSHVQSNGPLTVVAGLDDIVVVNSGDAVIVSAKSHVAELLQAHETGVEGDKVSALPQAALEMLRQAARSAPDAAGDEPEEAVDEEADENPPAEALTLAEVAHAAEEEALARDADGTKSAEAEELEPELPFDLEPAIAEEAEEEPPLLLHSSWESAA